MLFSFFILIQGCYPLVEKNIVGQLEVNPKWGSSISLFDIESRSYKDLSSGKYSLKFSGVWHPFQNPKIQILDYSNNKLMTIEIPKEQIKKDGTFELLGTSSKNSLQFNVLGGRREVVIERNRYSVIKESCTYTETYVCSIPCTDAKGNPTTCTSTCTRILSGNQDVMYEKQKVKSFYRILFDGSDLINAAVFNGESMIQNKVVTLNSTSCS
jgi:hypothetical protein